MFYLTIGVLGFTLFHFTLLYIALRCLTLHDVGLLCFTFLLFVLITLLCFALLGVVWLLLAASWYA